MTADVLRATGLTAGYGRPVVGPISFALSAGEVVGLWGPNGSGKSTLLRAILGAARIFAGEVIRRPDLTVAYLEQQPVRLPEMPLRGRELLALLDADRQRPPERLAGWLEQRVDRLSGGQFQLLHAWACLASGAELAVLDEPTNNLDPPGEALLIDLLRQRPPGHAVLLVSHEQAFLTAACDRVLELA